MRIQIAALLAVALGGLGSAALAAENPASSATCQALARAAFPDPTTVVISATARDAGPVGAASPFGPAPVAPPHCQVVGKMHERMGGNGQTYAVRFQARLPSNWNGRLFFEGGGGSDGVLGAGVGSLMGGEPGSAL